MEPIRVLHENVIMDPGGIETLLMNVYRHIDRERVQFDFMVHRPDKAFYEDEIESLGGRIYRTPKFSPFPGQYKQFMGSVERILRDHPEYKVIHAHAELNLWPLKIAKKLAIPTRIAHSHNAKTVFNLKYFFFLYEKIFIKKYCTDMFMCSTPAGVWTFGRKAVQDGKAKFIKNGVETERFAYNPEIREKKRKELNLDSKFVVGHVGRFMQQKNHTFLIDIFSEIYKKNPQSQLILVSDGRLMDEVKAKVKQLNLDSCVQFLGNRSDVNELMQAMDVFLFPSLWEGLPLTGIEAQSAGLPVVMSDVITDEVCVTNNIYTMSLSKSAKEWADKVLEVCHGFIRKDVRQQVIDAGFDILTTAKWLQDFYLKQYEK
ncbi:MAG: putative glycosyltransferase EpsF [Firmicutes bacterium ADurb.Bin419]|nr:MAG: putative glycosyltransferase EpsF [Firmicutes bacterium ADurb.Bin419]